MYLKSLEISGFKSFANKTKLNFLPPNAEGLNSITAVVGPNGSGKSNVSDAIRWVMGEQSMKQLRGKKSQDIIFSGSAAKGQLSLASVSMILDNSDRRADVEYDELVITRKIYRSGESEYVINGSRVRLIDLQLLLAKAQFGQGSYAVIGQGMIDKLLLQSPTDRKKFFDEATGIKEFQLKRHHSALRLERTKEHIKQAELLLHEVTPRLKSLSRQVKKLEERKELEINLRDAQYQYYASVHAAHAEQLKQIEEKIIAVDGQLKEKQEQLHTVQLELAELAKSASRQDAFLALQREHEELVSKKHQKEREKVVLQGKMQTEYSRSGNHEMGWIEGKVQQLKDQKNEISQKVEALKREITATKEQSNGLLSTLQDLQLERTTLKSAVQQLEAKLLQSKSEQSAFQMSGYRAVQAVLEARHELGQIEGVVAQLGRVEKQFQVALDVAAGGRLAAVVVADEYAAKASIQFLRDHKLGTATFLPLTKIRGREIPAYIYNFLGQAGVHGLAIDLIDFDEKYTEIFAFVFGSTIIVDDFDTAKRIGIGRCRMVTLQGDVFETSGSVRGGYRSQSAGRLSFAEALSSMGSVDNSAAIEQELQEKLAAGEQSEQQVTELNAQLQQLSTELSSKQAKQELLLDQQAQIDAERAELEGQQALTTMSKEEFGEAMEVLAQSKAQIEQDMLALEEHIQKAAEKLANFNQQEEAKKQRVFALQETMQSLQLELNTIVEQKNAHHVARAKVETKQEDLSEEVFTDMRMSLVAVLDRKPEVVAVDQLELLQSSIQKMKYKLSLIGSIDDETVTEYEETKARHDGLMNELDDLKKAVADLTKLIDELDKVMKKKRKSALKEIKQEFSRYFEQVFAGGKAQLVEIYGNEGDEEVQGDEIEAEEGSSKKSIRGKKILTGIDIVANPPGKKIQDVRALSGGERVMTSIALMCAILKTNPPPFVVLDEVEAALDEANTIRVINILKELSGDSQFVVITHNKATMHAADALYGVTMGGDGISSLLSVKVGE